LIKLPSLGVRRSDGTGCRNGAALIFPWIFHGPC
jgi:hypothetical protein